MWRRRSQVRVRLREKQVCVSRFFSARLASEHSYQRRLAFDQPPQGGVNVLESFKAVQALAAAAQLARSLSSAQQEQREERNFPPVKVKDLLQTVLIFRHPTVGPSGRTGQPLFGQRIESLANQILIQRHQRIAIVFLVAGIYQGIERQG